MFCPFCGHQVNDDSAFCMNCGKNLKINQTAAPEAASAVDNSNVQPPQPEYTAPQTPPVQQPVYTAPQTPPVQQPMYSAPTMAPNIPQMSIPVKANPFGWVKVLAILVVIAGIIFAAIQLLFPSDEDLIRDRIETFTEACNDGDIEVLIGCFDKKTRTLYDASMGIAEGLMGELIGFDLPWGDMMELGGLQLGGMMDVDIEIKSIKIDDDEAEVDMVMTANGETVSDVIQMCEEDGDWYIDASSIMGEVMKDQLDY